MSLGVNTIIDAMRLGYQDLFRSLFLQLTSLTVQILIRSNHAELYRGPNGRSGAHFEAIPKEQIIHTPAYYYQDGILMRMYRPPTLSDEDTWAENH